MIIHEFNALNKGTIKFIIQKNIELNKTLKFDGFLFIVEIYLSSFMRFINNSYNSLPLIVYLSSSLFM